MTLEQKIKLLSSDVLGTLVHLPSETDSGASLDDLTELGSRRYVHRETRQYLQELRQLGITVVLVSGMRAPSYNAMAPHLPHDYAAIEDGSLLLKDGRRDEEWENKLAFELLALNRYKDDLRKSGVIVDDLDRTASFRVNPVEYNDRKDLEQLTHDFPELEQFPQHVRRTTHKPFPPSYEVFQYVPASSGKANVLDFIMKRMFKSGGEEVTWENVAAFGDDGNDHEMMEQAAFPMTLIGANAVIQRLAVNRGGLVAPGYSHAGTIIALSHLIELVKAQT